MAFGVPVEVTNEFGEFLRRWGVRLRISSAYHAQSNGRAEVAVVIGRTLISQVRRSAEL